MNHRTLNRAALVSLAIVAAALLTLAYSHKARAAYADIGGSSPTATIAPTATPTTPNPTVQPTATRTPTGSPFPICCIVDTPVPTNTPNPTITLPIYNPIVWRTETVSLEANNFYVIADGKVFLGNTNMQVRSDPGNANYTTLEATWQEAGVEMRLYMYFRTTPDGGWNVSEVRSYNGRALGNWIFYPGFVGSWLGSTYRIGTLELVGLPSADPAYNVPGKVHWDNLRLSAFTNQQPTPTVVPTSTPSATRTPAPTATPNRDAPHAELLTPVYFLPGQSIDVPVIVRSRGQEVDSGAFQVVYPAGLVTSVAFSANDGIVVMFDQISQETTLFGYGILGGQLQDGQWVGTLRVTTTGNASEHINLVVRQNFLARAGMSLGVAPETTHVIMLQIGDADSDGVVTILDFSILAGSFNKRLNQDGFQSRADFNRDGVVSILDFSILASNFNRRTPGMG